MTVAELLSRISSQELTEWMAYYQVEPWGEERADLRHGILSATVANYSGHRKQPAKPKDFIPTFGPRQRQSPMDQLARVRAMQTVFEERAKAQKEGAK